MNNIPKKLHYVWIGDKDKPEIFYECCKSWKEKMQGYEIVEINEKNFDMNYHLTRNKFFKKCYELKLWAYVADYMRVHYLYENGGIFLDTDMEIIKNFFEIEEIKNISNIDFFTSFESDEGIGLGLFGVKPKSIILKKIIKFYEKEVWETPYFTLPQIIRYILINKLGYDITKKEIIDKEKGILILKKEYFYPFLPHEKWDKSMIKDENFAIHWWYHSWKGHKPLLFLKTKHLKGIKKYIKKLGIYWQMFRDFIRGKK